jgi:hypothetical protein
MAQAPMPTPQVMAQASILDPSAFDLETVSGLIRSGQVTDAAGLERIINSGGDGNGALNMVDVDHDGQVDYVSVQETSSPDGVTHTFLFIAMPSSRSGPNVQFASVQFTMQGNQVVVQASYAPIVRGYDQYFYTYYVPRGPSFSQVLFWSWLFRPSRMAYMGTPYGYGYHPYRVMSPDYVTRTRTTYRTTTHVSPIPRAAPPPSYKNPVAEPVRSRLATPTAPTGPGLSGRSDSVVPFEKRDVAKPKAQGTAFGGAPATPPPVANPSPTFKPQPTSPTFKAQPNAPPPATRPPPPAPAPSPRAPAPTFKAQPKRGK